MIDGVSSSPFSAATQAPIPKPSISYKHDIIEASRAAFATPRGEVEEAIKKWHEEGAKGPSAPFKEGTAPYKPGPKPMDLSASVSSAPRPPISSAPIQKREEPRPQAPAASQPAQKQFTPKPVQSSTTPAQSQTNPRPERRTDDRRNPANAFSAIQIPDRRSQDRRSGEQKREVAVDAKKEKQAIFESIMMEERKKQQEKSIPSPISLHTLRSDAKKNDKSGTPQHVSDLKKALEILTATKQASPSPAPSQIKKQPQPQTQPKHEPASQVQRPQPHVSKPVEQVKSEPAQPKQEIPKEAPKEMPIPQKEIKKNVHEIPESELLDLLRVDL